MEAVLPQPWFAAAREPDTERGWGRTLYIVGLATDYCVKQTVLDGCKLGYRVVVLEDAVRGVNLQPDDSQLALQDMVAAGALKATASDLSLDS